MKQNFMRTRTVELNVYAECKYQEKEIEETIVTYENAIAFEVLSGDKAKAYEIITDGSMIDDYHEYLVIYFDDNTTATFRNSYVDLFVW